VICRQLGYAQGAQQVFGNSYFGLVPEVFAYDNVKCNGSEASLDACNHLNFDDCGPNEGAGVVCIPNKISKNAPAI